MIRRVNFKKAILAGVAGAVCWELLARLMLLAGVPAFDIVMWLGTLFLGNAPVWEWWPLGLALHVSVGSIWAIFYAYFFWSDLHVAPACQGLIFISLPVFLAGLFMVPQLGYMHPFVVSGAIPNPGVFAFREGVGGPLGVVLGHGIYGLVLGLIYTRPVGYPVHRKRAHG